MNRSRISRIAIQLGLAGTFLLVLVLSLVWTNLVREQRSFVVGEMNSKADLLAKNISIVCQQSFYPRPDQFFLGYMSEELLKDRWIYGIALYDKDGQAILSKRKADTTVSNEEFEIIRPILLQSDKVGEIRMVFSSEPLRLAIQRVERRIAFIALGAIVAGLFILIIAVPFLVRPILELADASIEVGKGNFEIQVKYKSKNEIGFLGTTFNAMVKGLKEREIIRSKFGRYFSPQVAEAIMNRNVSLDGERRDVTVLMTDIRDFTAFSEKLPPEEVVRFLNDYFSRMVSIIHKHQGTVDKFIGDAILGIFSAPLPVKDHQIMAARCALEMKRALTEMNLERAKRGEAEIHTGMALCSGPAVTGNIGAKEKSEYTVIGDTVNLASRMEGLTKRFGAEIVVNRAVADAIQSQFKLENFGMQGIRGRKEPAEIFGLLGEGKSENLDVLTPLRTPPLDH